MSTRQDIYLPSMRRSVQPGCAIATHAASTTEGRRDVTPITAATQRRASAACRRCCFNVVTKDGLPVLWGVVLSRLFNFGDGEAARDEDVEAGAAGLIVEKFMRRFAFFQQTQPRLAPGSRGRGLGPGGRREGRDVDRGIRRRRRTIGSSCDRRRLRRRQTVGSRYWYGS